MSGTLPRQDKSRLKPLILVVEDEAVIAVDIRDALGHGYDVVGPVARGEDAIRVAEESRPDLVLMDIHLQGATDSPIGSCS